MKIRESVECDKESIREVHLNAFDPPEAKIASQLAIDLLEDRTARRKAWFSVHHL
jgi:hypothetical protein